MENIGDRTEPVVRERPPSRITRVLTFRGPQESELLTAAGSWMAEHRHGVIVSLAWQGDLAPGESTPLWQMEMVIEGTA